MSQIATAIAAAVEQQGARPQEIARNVQEAATARMEVSSNIAGVSDAVEPAPAATAGEVLKAADSPVRRRPTRCAARSTSSWRQLRAA